jgi:hypothetical protein
VSGTHDSVLTPFDKGAALLELAPNVLLTDPESSQAHLNALNRLVQDCACYRLDTGRCLTTAVAQLLELVG